MKQRRTVLNRLLTGATIVLVIASASCSHRPSPTALCPPCMTGTQASEPRGASAEPLPQWVRFSSDAPNVNIFGEVDGLAVTRGRLSSEVSFVQHTFTDEGFDGEVAVSPDGKWLAFASTRHNLKADLYLKRVDGVSVTQLTNDDADDAFPAFSPDGSRIAFSSTRGGSWDVYVMDVDGRNLVQVTSGPSHDLHPSFSPQGDRLVYCSLGAHSGQWELWTVDLQTNQRRMIGHGLFPVWSPELRGDRIAFQRARARGSRWFSLWTMELVDGEPRNLTEVAVSSNAAIVSPAWSPDGRRLAFSTIVEPARTKDGKPVGQQDVWVVNADGTNRQRLTDGRGINATPAWGADGRVYFVSDRGGTESIWSASASGSTPTMNAGGESKPDHQRQLGPALAAPDLDEMN